MYLAGARRRSAVHAVQKGRKSAQRQIEVGGPFPADAVAAVAAVEAAKNGLEYRPTSEGKAWSLVRKERRLTIEASSGAENAAEMLELERQLNLAPGRKSYDITVGTRGHADPMKFPNPPGTELRIVPRSTAQVLYYLANGVEVPPTHLCSGLADHPLGPDGQPFDLRQITQGLFQVKAVQGHKPPDHAYVAIRYRDFWFYIDERDQESKASFALVFQLSRLDFARQTLGAGPTLTLPVGR